ncbi:MAG: hypothetical protein GY822_06690 [Deltaproteobacteria bacterium]|nr:hypothetical protein [Deltaproteobacteria bacterium]
MTSCQVVSSPGAYGFTPWVDYENQYYAVLAMESDQTGGAFFSLPLMEELCPDIEALLRGE